ncbi:hypothetical protein Q9233_008851 [Columba guinea]|nr:hypothetical protein Q9233_008851 [Columba guinea]
MGSWIVGFSFTPNFGGRCSTDPAAAQPEGEEHPGTMVDSALAPPDTGRFVLRTQGLALGGQTDMWTPDRLQEPLLPEDAISPWPSSPGKSGFAKQALEAAPAANGVFLGKVMVMLLGIAAFILFCDEGPGDLLGNLGRSFWKGEANLVFSGLKIEQVEGGHPQTLPSLFKVKGTLWIYSELTIDVGDFMCHVEVSRSGEEIAEGLWDGELYNSDWEGRKVKVTQELKNIQVEQMTKLQAKHQAECELLEDISNLSFITTFPFFSKVIHSIQHV